MPGVASLQELIHNRLKSGDLPFHEFVQLALYHPELGYYRQGRSPVGKAADFVTSPSLSPVFSYSLGKLVREFLSRSGGGLSQIVDVGAGDGTLINNLRAEVPEASFVGVERGDPIPRAGLAISNELFDAQPFARLVQRGSELHELTVVERDGQLDWGERPADQRYVDYFKD